MIDEIRQLSALIADIYDAALIQATWPDVLAKVSGFVGGASVNFYSQSSSSREAILHLQWGNDPHYEQLYLEEYYKLNPLTPATSFVDAGIVFSQSDLIPYAEFEETRFYKEWVAPQGFVDVIGANLEKSATSAAMLAVRRNATQGRVDAECRRKLELVVPHLRRSVMIGNVIDDHKMTAAALSGAFMALADGVFLVDPRARIVFSQRCRRCAAAQRQDRTRTAGSFGSGRRQGQSPAAGSDRNHRGRCKRHERQGRCRAVVRLPRINAGWPMCCR